MRRAHFTVRHDISMPCGHKLDKLNEPRLGCEFCWFNWFEMHAELVRVADEAFIREGKAFLDKMRGVRFRKMFTRFMATKLKLQQETDALQRNAGGTGSETTPILSEEQGAPARSESKMGAEQPAASTQPYQAVEA